ncbi:hypothetical protein Tco_1125428 [Tanacetum coccineum]|uniref:Reverse transcriptase Ty1/copia-type domain-containing protein n=1 Tax=Tanacetum coccineum TaxID=301880 RepID=A0ABQ5JC03_9ASTR
MRTCNQFFLMTYEEYGFEMALDGHVVVLRGLDKWRLQLPQREGHFARRVVALKKSRNKNKEKLKMECSVETSTSPALVSLVNGLGWFDCSDSEIVDNFKKGLGYEKYNAVLPPYTRNFMPPTPDSFGLDEFVNEPVVENSKAMSSEEEPKVVRKIVDGPNIEELIKLVRDRKSRTPHKMELLRGGIRTLIEAASDLLADSSSGPDWLFDIDALTRTMNYEPIVVGTQSNGFAGTKASDNVDYSIFDVSRDDEDVDAEADMNNLDYNNPRRTKKDNSYIEGSKLDRGYAGRASTIQENLNSYSGLQVQQKKDGIFISQDMYVEEILKKFGFTEVKTASTPMETQKAFYTHRPKLLMGKFQYKPCDGKKIIVTESTVRRDLQLEDAEGMYWFTKSNIFL